MEYSSGYDAPSAAFNGAETTVFMDPSAAALARDGPGGDRMPYYPTYHPSGKGAQGINRGEVVFTLKSHTHDGRASRVLATTSLAGQGEEANSMFSDAPKLVMSQIRDDIQVLGVARDSLQDGVSADSAVAVAVTGQVQLRKVDTRQVFRPGQFVSATMPKPTKGGPSVTIGPGYVNGIPREKATLVPEVTEAKVIGSDRLAQAFDILTDEAKWSAFNRERIASETNGTEHAISTLFDGAIFAGLHFCYQMMQRGYLMARPHNAWAAHGDPTQPGAEPLPAVPNTITADSSSFDFFVEYAHRFGLLPEGIRDVPFAELESWQRVKRRVLLGSFSDGSVRNADVGHFEGAPTRTPRGVVNTARPEGRLLEMQLNHHARQLSALLGALDDEAAFRLGKVMAPSPEGAQFVTIVLTPGSLTH